ncbi:hypothetical protein LOC54_06520 [Acetobacter sp. AN02]|uniref:hypothetical protein n=1 Tax=Acetobacter sp. AN02 TaxID=2894186 RepID=UPI0024341810|nr:hypothetical protein [Acetobacter sp. AN02]MDG6094764.1 hypothetical protein [Acetobacter sp. AN02]
MHETTGCDASWHLIHSRPSRILAYFTPSRGFSAQLNPLISRFRDVNLLCCGESCDERLCHLRDELAFHLVRMSRWWGFEFCPRALTDMRGQEFMTCVRAHIDRNADDAVFFDLFTMQHHMRTGDPDHVLVLGRGSAPGGARVLYGADGQKRFRFATETGGRHPVWHEQVCPDFVSAWLAASAFHTPADAGCDGVINEYVLAGIEHERARTWHQQHLYGTGARNVVRLYADALLTLSSCQSRFGRMEFEAIANALAFGIMSLAFERRICPSDLIDEEGESGKGTIFTASIITRRARSWVMSCVDPYQRPDCDALIDHVVRHSFRRCS